MLYFCKVYKIFKIRLFLTSMSKSQHTLSSTISSFVNCIYSKVRYCPYHNSNLFSEKIDKKETQVFYQNHSLALHTVEIFCNLILENHWTWTWKILDYFTGPGLTFLFIGLGLENYLNYLTGLGLVLWYIGVRLQKYPDSLTWFWLFFGYIRLGIEKYFG